MNTDLKIFFGGLAFIVLVGCTVAFAFNGKTAFADIKTMPPASRGHESDPSTHDLEWRTQQKADQAYATELKKETAPTDTSRELNRSLKGQVRYWCVDGFVYIFVGHGFAPYISDLTMRPQGFTKCEDFK
jgi:hypothetical protein